MKAVFLVIFLIQAITYEVLVMTKEEKHDFLMKMSTECRKESGAGEADIKEMFDRELPTTKEGKCLRSCIMKKLDIIKDGKLNITVAVEFIKVSSNGDTKLVELAQQMSEECVAVSDADECIYTGKLLECYQNAAKSRGVDYKKMF